MEEQRLPGLGAHNVELMSAPDGERLLAVANQGDGADCATGSLDVYARRSGRWALSPLHQAGKRGTDGMVSGPSNRVIGVSLAGASTKGCVGPLA